MSRHHLQPACSNWQPWQQFQDLKGELVLWGLIFKNDSIEFFWTKENPEKSQLPWPDTVEADGIWNPGRRQSRYPPAKIQASYIKKDPSTTLETGIYQDTPGWNGFCDLAPGRRSHQREWTLQTYTGCTSWKTSSSRGNREKGHTVPFATIPATLHHIPWDHEGKKTGSRQIISYIWTGIKSIKIYK